MSFRLAPSFSGTLARKSFLVNNLLALLAVIGLSAAYGVVLVLFQLLGIPSDAPVGLTVSILFFLAAIIVSVGAIGYVGGLCVRRARSIGASPWICVVLLIPYANVAFWFLLAIWPPRLGSAPAGAAAPVALTDESSPAVAPTGPVTESSGLAAPAKTSWMKQAAGAAGVLVVIVSIAVGRLVADGISSTGNGPVAERAQTLLASTEHKEYVSAEHGFRATFPGFPSIERETLEIDGQAVPFTTYLASVDADADARAIFIYDYSLVTNNPADMSLEGALIGMVQGTAGGQLVATSASSLGGIEGLAGHYRMSLDGVMVDNYAVLVTRGTKLYVALGSGIPQSEFDAFAGAVRFE